MPAKKSWLRSGHTPYLKINTSVLDMPTTYHRELRFHFLIAISKVDGTACNAYSVCSAPLACSCGFKFFLICALKEGAAAFL